MLITQECIRNITAVINMLGNLKKANSVNSVRSNEECKIHLTRNF